MAISVKSTAWKGVTGSTSIAITVAPTAGNALFVSFNAFNGTVGNHAVTDNKGTGTWVRLPNSGTSAGGAKISRWVQFNVPSGLTTVTLNGGAGTGAITGIIHEIVGVTTYTTGEQANATYVSTTNPQTGAVTNATANSVFFAALTNDSINNPATLTVNSTGSSPTGWQLADSTHSQETNASANLAASVPYLIVSSSASTVHGWTTGAFSGVKTLCCFNAGGNTTTTRTQLGKARIQATTTKTQLGNARIRVTTTRTQAGKARIRTTVPQTQLGKSRIQATATKTQLGKSRVQTTTTRTQLGKARIRQTVPHTQPGKARIQTTTPQTQLGKARITTNATTTQDQSGVSRVQNTSSQFLLGMARIVSTPAPVLQSIGWVAPSPSYDDFLRELEREQGEENDANVVEVVNVAVLALLL